jgi:PAS domain S-box-containing protein
MPLSALFSRFRDLQAYVGWSDDDSGRIRAVAPRLEQHLPRLIDDFYAEISRHPDAARVITGGDSQVARLKASLRAWLTESFAAVYDANYIERRWKIGLRHAEIGLNPAYTSAAVARLRNGLLTIVSEYCCESGEPMHHCVQSINKLLDVELAIINDAYGAEYLRREKQAEHERGEVKFQLLVEAAACMVVILRPDHSIAYFGPYCEELTGYTAAEVTGQNFLFCFVPEPARQRVCAEIDATGEGHPTNGYESPLLCRNGEHRWLAWNTRRLDDFDGRPGILAVGHDFTDRREAQARLLQSERLAAIGQMITGIAHESRNALQRIQACSEMLELEVEGQEEPLQLLHRMQAAQDTLVRLFEEVRTYAAPIQLEYSPCRLESTWREAWALLESTRRGRDTALVESCDGIQLQATVDRFRVVQLFRNMMENSLAAGRDPVIVEVTCRDVDFKGRPAIEIRYRDNGPGLSSEAARSVFEPFFTTKTKGTGLGMAIARRIVEAHGGKIEAALRSHQGAEFVVTLPRSPS